MLVSYRRVFAHPGALAFSVTGLVARLPISMMTLGIVLLVSALTGSYGLAGQVSAAYIAGNAAFAVPHGRLADRFGQGRVLYVDSVLFAVASSLMIVSISENWASPLPHVLGALAGASIPQIGTMVRGRWAHLLEVDSERHTAFAVEGVADEIVFVTGPALVTFLSTVYAPQSGLVVAIVAGTLGTVALAAQRRTEPPAHPPDPTVARTPMPWRLLVPVTVGALALGSVFGALEVATVAFADDAGHRAVSGLMLGAFAMGSLVAGVWAGAMVWQRGPLPRARIGMGVLVAGASVLPLMPDLVAVTVALLLTGLALAPTLIAIFSLIEASVPRARLNEAMGFVQTGMSAGIAPGAWLAGVVADTHGGSSAYWVCAVSALLAALAGIAVREPLRAER
ncbi:MAG: transporter [Marmoricola sp.]|nr:transporter [Marmoricola sp.]MCW2838332.1 transporter [Marmoricola sp.]